MTGLTKQGEAMPDTLKEWKYLALLHGKGLETAAATIKKMKKELTKRENYWRDWNGRAANHAAGLEGRIIELEQNCAFFRCCAMCGEQPEEGAEPFPPDNPE